MVMALALTALARDRNDDTPVTLAVGGAARAESLMSFLAGRAVTIERIGDPAALKEDIRARRRAVALEVAPEYGGDFRAMRPAHLTLLFDSAWNVSRSRADKIRALIGEYGRGVNDTRLILRGVLPSSVAALDVNDQDVSTAASRAGSVLGTLPIFLLLAAFVGGMSVAADVTAGERERGSLESLLMHPVPRGALIAGKWAATTLTALATIAVTLAVTNFVLQNPRIQAIDLPVGVSARDAIQMWLVLAPLAVFAAALQLLAALHARTYKEAQTQLTLLMFAPMIPGFMFAFGSLQPSAWMTWLPVTGQHLVVADVVRGTAPENGTVAILSVVTLGLSALTLWVAAMLLSQERIIRRLVG
jgi:sodium transport system permease protein